MSNDLVLVDPGYITAPPPPESLPSDWNGVQHLWTGWDGSVWDLTNPNRGAFIIAGGLEGMGMPDIVNYWTDSPVVHGKGWQGWIATGRKVYWQVGLFHDESSAAWIRRDRAFWKTFRPGTVGTWTVVLPVTGERLHMRLRFVTDGPHKQTTDPAFAAWEVYGIELEPEQPFWEGDKFGGDWGVSTQQDFVPAGTLGPPFYISEASDVSTATLTNPGDVETSLRWTVVGPAGVGTAFGVQGQQTVLPFALTLGQTLVVDTDPRNLIAERNGVDVMPLLASSFRYPQLPPGEDVTLDITLNGSGRIYAEAIPYYLRGHG